MTKGTRQLFGVLLVALGAGIAVYVLIMLVTASANLPVTRWVMFLPSMTGATIVSALSMYFGRRLLK